MEKMVHLIAKIAVMILVSLDLTGCIQIYRLPLDINQRKKIVRSQEILCSSQKDIQVEQLNPAVYYSAAPGILGLVVGAGINRAIVDNETHRANELIKPLHQNLIDYHFNEKLNQQLTKELSSITWLHLHKKQVTGELDEFQKRKLANQMSTPGDALIYVDLSYKLSKISLDTLIITAKVSIFRKENSQAILSYQNLFKYLDQLPRQKKPQDYVQRWSEHQALRARDSMDTALRLISKIVVQDILDSSIRPKKNVPTTIWYNEGRQNSGLAKAHLEEKIGNHYVLRTNFGYIIIASESLVSRKHNWRE